MDPIRGHPWPISYDDDDDDDVGSIGQQYRCTGLHQQEVQTDIVLLCYVGQMQAEGQVEGHRQGTGGRWRLQLAEALRQAVLRGQAIRVHQLLNDGAPLVTDRVMCIFI